jgi:hypothetical protein
MFLISVAVPLLHCLDDEYPEYVLE